MSLNAEGATAACAEYFPSPLPVGHRLRAHPVDGTDLWSVNAVDGRAMPYAGSFLVVGPDGRVWPFSSNPVIHDSELVVDFLSEAYRKGLAGRIEPERLAVRIRAITEERASQVRTLIQEAEAGQLRTQQPRQLP